MHSAVTVITHPDVINKYVEMYTLAYTRGERRINVQVVGVRVRLHPALSGLNARYIAMNLLCRTWL
jgi:hypothetical protein